MKAPKRGTRWRHYKGGVYDVLYVAKHSESLEEMIVYKNLKHNSIWVRPLYMWFDEVNNGSQMRFEQIKIRWKCRLGFHKYEYDTTNPNKRFCFRCIHCEKWTTAATGFGPG